MPDSRKLRGVGIGAGYFAPFQYEAWTRIPEVEIAAITDTPLGSVKGRLHRARRDFIDMLRANTYDWELPQ